MKYSGNISVDSNEKLVRFVFSGLSCSIAITLMIFVNYGGGGYYFFGHAAWNGKHILHTVILRKTKELDKMVFHWISVST